MSGYSLSAELDQPVWNSDIMDRQVQRIIFWSVGLFATLVLLFVMLAQST
jgi:hypothetical protein